MSLNKKNEEQELLGLLKQGDEHAFASIMKRYYHQLYNYATRFGADEMDIKDAIQEVFISLWNRREFAEAILSLRFYLLKAVKNNILKVLLAKNKHISFTEIDIDYHFSVEFSIEQKLINKQFSSERASKIKKTLETLSIRQKEIIFLRFYAGLGQNQIANIMNINKQSVYNLLHESLLRLKKILDPSLVLQC